jgi:dienelactone hydrolase
MRRLRILFKTLSYVLMFTLILGIVMVLYLRIDSRTSRDEWFEERRGTLVNAASSVSETLTGNVRLIRNEHVPEPLPVLIMIVGHRTGRDAVELFGDVGNRAVIAIDYPYDGPERPKGVVQTTRSLPKARAAILDTVPVVSLLVDWIVEQPWADAERIVIVGVSFGVPFAAQAATLDRRIAGVMLVHGAADNRLWMETQVARRTDSKRLHYPLSVVLNWMAYGPIFDTAEHVAEISPRSIVIVAGRDDERTPAGQPELLYQAAGEPKRLRYTEGGHVDSSRPHIVEALMQIMNEEMEFLSGQ